MKDSKVERIRQKAMLFGRQFLQGDTGVFDHALGVHAMAAVMSMQAPGCRERIYAPLDTLRLFVGQGIVGGSRLPGCGGTPAIGTDRAETIFERTQYRLLLRCPKPIAARHTDHAWQRTRCATGNVGPSTLALARSSCQIVRRHRRVDA